MRMRAAVLRGVGERLEFGEVELEPPRQGEVLVKIVACGLCASDLNSLTGKRTLSPFPVILGHEAAGVVAETGPGVTRLCSGDRVVISIVPFCGRCAMCRQGRPNYCTTASRAMSEGNLMDGSSRLTLDGHRLNHFLAVSSFAEYAVVPESGVVAVDAAMPLDRAALIGCAVLTGFGAVHNTAHVPPGASVAVFGCGGVGLNVIQGARIAGAEPIVAVDVHEAKLLLAHELGATHTLNARTVDAPAAVREISAGGVDYAFEAAGRPETVEQAWASLAIGGEVVVVGLMGTGQRLTLDAGPLIDEKRIRGCYLGSSRVATDVPALVRRYLSGELRLDAMISRVIGLDEINEGCERLRAGEEARQLLRFDV